MFVIFCKTDVKAVNPTFFIIGLNISKIVIDTSGTTMNAIHGSKLKVGDRVKFMRFGGAYNVRKSP